MFMRVITFFLLCLCALQSYAQQQFSQIAAIGDLNGDGKPDVVVANGTLNNIGVFLNTGTGALGAGAFIGVGANADAVRLADFNSDGHLDALVFGANPGSNPTLKLLLGDGKGGFGTPVDVLPAGVNMTGGLAVADFNGDGIPDVAFDVGASNPKVAVMFGNGAAGFSAPHISVVALDQTVAGSLLVMDANHDGIPDLVINTSRSISNQENAYVALGDGAGGFKMVQIPDLQVLAVGDFNGDTNPDFLLGSGIGDTQIRVAFGDGQGGVLYQQLSPVILASPLGNPFAIDIDGDKTIDLISGHYFPGNGHGGFGDPINFLSGSPAGSLIGIADLNGDGKPDFVVLASGSTNVFSVLNTIAAPASIAAATQTSIAASATTTNTGATITLLARVISNGGVPVGNVTFTEGATTLGGAPVDAFGWAALDTSFATGGLHSNLNATFSGALDATTNTTFGDSSSPFSASVSVNSTPPTAAPPTVNLSASLNPVLQRSADLITAAVSSSSGTPTGEVVLKLDGQVFDLVPVAQQTFEIFPDAGLHNFEGDYGGDGTFPAATSATLVEDVRAFNAPRTPSSTKISLTPGPNGGFNMNATVSGTSAPTSNIVYRINGAFFITAAPNFPVFFDTGAGAYNVSAEYPGDAVLAPSSSTATIVLGNPAGDFSISASSSVATIKAGQSATFTFTITPSGGFSLPVNFSCSGLPSGASCTFSPASVTPLNGAAVSSTLTITTTAPRSATLTVSRSHHGSYRWPCAATFAFGLLLIGNLGKGRKSRKLGRVSATLLFLLLLASCGGGSTTTPAGTNGTPQGTSTVTVTANSAVSHTVPLTITVQ